MLDNLRRQIRAEAEATLNKALSRARQEAVQALRRAVLSLIGVMLALFGMGYATFAAFVWLRGEFGPLWAASGLAGLLFALAAICVGFAAVIGRKPQDEEKDEGSAEESAVPAAPVTPTLSHDAADTAAVSDLLDKPAAAPASPATEARVPSSTAASRNDASGTLQAVMSAVSDEIENDTARAILKEGTRQVGALSAWQMGLLAAATGFLYAQNAPRRRR